MPTTHVKNLLYRAALPFLSPGPGRDCVYFQEGHPLTDSQTFEKIIRRHHVLGSAALLAGRDHRCLLLTRSDRPVRQPSRNSCFRVASITKMATALAVLRCTEEGSLALDEPVVAFLPPEGRVDALSTVTLRMLLSHTGGLSDPPELESFLISGKSYPELMNRSQCFFPDHSFHYSNLGFGLIGCVLEAVRKQPVSRVLEDLVFHPLNMRATLDPTTLRDEEILPISRILPYQAGNDLIRTQLGSQPLSGPDPLRHYGHTAGSMYTDIESLERLITCLKSDGKPLLHPDTGREMRRVHATYGKESPTMSYGLGLLCIRDPRLSSSSVWGHQGFAYGCADGAFWEESTGNILIFLNGGCSEARDRRLGLCNRDLLKWAFRKELPSW